MTVCVKDADMLSEMGNKPAWRVWQEITFWPTFIKGWRVLTKTVVPSEIAPAYFFFRVRRSRVEWWRRKD